MTCLTKAKSSGIRVLSSANKQIFIWWLSIYIRLMSLLFLILFASARMNRYGDWGHPCLTPVSSWQNLPVWPGSVTMTWQRYILYTGYYLLVTIYYFQYLGLFVLAIIALFRIYSCSLLKDDSENSETFTQLNNTQYTVVYIVYTSILSKLWFYYQTCYIYYAFIVSGYHADSYLYVW